MEENKFCPADDLALKTIATLVGRDGAQKIRVGYCVSCGYVGYIDRPTKDWINRFYLTTWDRAEEKNTDEVVAMFKNKFQQMDVGKKGELGRLEEIDKKFNFNKNQYALDLGCGYGKKMKLFADLGFKNVVGIENSAHRAEVARKIYSFRVFTSAFEDPSTQVELKKLWPIELIHSKHVLEHTYNPAEIIRLASLLQARGGYFVLSLPNILGEISLLTLIFFPHLHGFSKDALECLMNKYGYEVVDNKFTTSEENYVIARKLSAPIVPKKNNLNYTEILINKFKQGLAFGDYDFTPRLFWCSRKKDIGGQIAGGLILRNYFHFTNRNQKILSALVEELKTRYTSFEESPIEIQFSGNIKLAYK